MIFTKFYIRIFKILINKVSINRETIYLGTNYGGWSLIDQPKLKNNYKLVKTSRYPNFLFIKDSFV